MTCIVALKHKDNIYMGGDASAVEGSHRCINYNRSKVFINGNFLIGYTTSFRMGQLLEHSFVPPKQSRGIDDMEFMVTSFVDSIKDVFKANGFGSLPDKTGHSGGTFLIGYKKQLYKLIDDFSIITTTEGYDACGSGVDYAVGSLYTSSMIPTLVNYPEERISYALTAASTYVATVYGPYNILKI